MASFFKSRFTKLKSYLHRLVIVVFLLILVFVVSQDKSNSPLSNMAPFKFTQQPTDSDAIESDITSQTRIIIVSEWRTGSSFLFDLFDYTNMAFSIFEPFLMYKNLAVRKLRNWKNLPEALDVSKDILKCNRLSRLFDKNGMMLRRTHLFEMCKKTVKNIKKCTRKSYLQKMCQSLPITLMKYVRISFDLMENLLMDQEINENLHVILLARDPRSVMLSRWNKKKTGWCSAECSNVDVHCKDMAEDLTAWHDMREKFPGQVHLIRFEDMALNPMDTAEKIFKDLDLDINENVRDFINYRTKTVSNKTESTIRVSKSRVIPWTSESDFETIHKVQSACSSVIESYGYNLTNTLNNISVSDIVKPFPVT